MLLQPNGLVSPCCWNQELVYGNIEDQTLAEIWNGTSIQKLRKEFLDGDPQHCSYQMKDIGCHRLSYREIVKNLQFTEIQTSGPIRLDIRLNGQCNLQCIMCDVWKQPNGLYNESDFWELGQNSLFPNLLELDVLGGEPFIQADTYRLIDNVSAVNSKCTWAFATNGNYRFSDEIRSKLDKIQIRWLMVSIDSLNSKAYSEIRLKGKIERTVSTLEQFRKYKLQRISEKRSFRLVASMCVQKQNWKEIPNFIEYCQIRDIEPVFQFLYSPAKLSLIGLPIHELKEVYTFICATIETYKTELLKPIYSPIKEVLYK